MALTSIEAKELFRDTLKGNKAVRLAAEDLYLAASHNLPQPFKREVQVQAIRSAVQAHRDWAEQSALWGWDEGQG